MAFIINIYFLLKINERYEIYKRIFLLWKLKLFVLIDNTICKTIKKLQLSKPYEMWLKN